MKVKNLKLSNFAKYDEIDASFDDEVTYLIGKNGSGKSTLGINAIWFMFQGIAEKASDGKNPLVAERFRFIGPRGASAKGSMVLIDEKSGVEVTVYRKITKSGTELHFDAPEGMDLDQKWLTDLFNVFLIAPKKFTELTPKEQAKALGIDTKTFDDDAAALKRKYTELNAVFNSYGPLPEEPEIVEPVLMNELIDRKEKLKEVYNKQYIDNRNTNKKIRDDWEARKKQIDQEVTSFNLDQQIREKKQTEVLAAWNQLKNLGYNDADYCDGIANWYKTFPNSEPLKEAYILYPHEPIEAIPDENGIFHVEKGDEHTFFYIPELPDNKDLIEIDRLIADAGIINQKANTRKDWDALKDKIQAKQKELTENKGKQKEKEKERIDYIKKFKFPFDNIGVDDDGQLLLNGKPIKEPYFSTGEILKIVPILLSTANPELKYIFLQEFNLMDEEKQQETIDFLLAKGYQLVIEIIGKTKFENKNCILLRDNIVVDTYQEAKEPTLNI